MEPQTLSVVIITHNEEAKIRACLESVAWASEIIVVDSLSTDATVRICSEFTERIHIREWPGYASQKNFGIDQASGDWILILDADERVSADLRSEIQALLAAPSPHAAFRIPFKNYLGRHWLAHGGLYPDYHPRLFRKGAARYGRREIHESLQIDGTQGRLNGAIEHLTYEDIATYLQKVNHYTTLEARHLAREGFRVRKRHFLKPLGKFFKVYIRKKGFLDGRHGLTSALFLSLYPYLVYAKVLELQEPPDSAE